MIYITVYIDSFFLINFLFDFIVVIIAGRLGGVRFSPIRYTLSALSGAALSVASLFVLPVKGLLGKMVVIALMSIIAFGYKGLKNFLKQTALLFMGFFICGGAAGMLSFFGYGKVYGGIYFSDVPMIPFLCLILIVMSAIFFVTDRIKEGRFKQYAKITVFTEEGKYILTGLYDSGNLCVDFQSGLPVIIAEDVFGNIKTREEYFGTASGQGVMRIFLPEYIEVAFNGKVFVGKDVAVGIVKGKLSNDGGFNALIGGICCDRLSGKNKKAPVEIDRQR